jgi:hypothetical protein
VPHDSRGESLTAEIGQELMDWNNVEGGDWDFLTSLIMCQKEKMESSMHVTVRVTVKKEDTARHLCLKGVFIFSTHCRVAVYRRWKTKA